MKSVLERRTAGSKVAFNVFSEEASVTCMGSMETTCSAQAYVQSDCQCENVLTHLQNLQFVLDTRRLRRSVGHLMICLARLFHLMRLQDQSARLRKDTLHAQIGCPQVCIQNMNYSRTQHLGELASISTDLQDSPEHWSSSAQVVNSSCIQHFWESEW